MQPKLKFNRSSDRYEREADRVAEQATRSRSGEARTDRSNASPIQVQRLRPDNPDATEKSPPSIVDDVLRTPGRPLDRGTREKMEPSFGHDFSHVRIHADSRAAKAIRAIHARAFTVGSHIVVDSADYARETPDGRRLLAHELTHVIQQTGSSNPSVVQRRVVDDDRWVTCRATRAGAVRTLQEAEQGAMRLARLASAHIETNLILWPLSQALGEGPGLRNFRDILWRRFHLDFNDPHVRDQILPLWARRYRLVADWIARLRQRYVCAAPGNEPPGECRTRPGRGLAWTASGLNRTQLCDAAWTADLPETILHEWFHFGFDWLGDCEQARNRNNTVCWELFASELTGAAAAADYAACCPPPADPLPAFAPRER